FTFYKCTANFRTQQVFVRLIRVRNTGAQRSSTRALADSEAMTCLPPKKFIRCNELDLHFTCYYSFNCSISLSKLALCLLISVLIFLHNSSSNTNSSPFTLNTSLPSELTIDSL